MQKAPSTSLPTAEVHHAQEAPATWSEPGRARLWTRPRPRAEPAVPRGSREVQDQALGQPKGVRGGAGVAPGRPDAAPAGAGEDAEAVLQPAGACVLLCRLPQGCTEGRSPAGSPGSSLLQRACVGEGAPNRKGNAWHRRGRGQSRVRTGPAGECPAAGFTCPQDTRTLRLWTFGLSPK